MSITKRIESRLNKITKRQWLLIVLPCIIVLCTIVGIIDNNNNYGASPAITLQPQPQIDWQSDIDEFEKQYREAEGNEVKQKQIGDLAQSKLAPAINIVDWVGTVQKIEDGIIKTDVAELHPNNTSSLGSINVGSVIKFSGTLEVKGLPGVWREYWRPEPVVNDCSYTIVESQK